MANYTLECCVDSVESALLAAEGGADRLELCSNLIIGGTTPTLALYEQIRAHSDIRVHALIRPRFGDFLYSEEELAVIRREIMQFRKAGAEGVVIGCLTAEGDLDTEAMKPLIEAAGDMSVTLHRAFDMCRNPLAALEEARGLGIGIILTSGQAGSCLSGLSLLNQLQETAGSAVSIMAGAGVSETAVRTLLQETCLTAFHMSGKRILESGMRYRNPAVSMGLPSMSEYEIWQTDPEAVRRVRTLLQ